MHSFQAMAVTFKFLHNSGNVKFCEVKVYLFRNGINFFARLSK